jgi:hypothetical protein
VKRKKGGDGMNPKLKEKTLESLAAVLPITGIVMFISVFFVPVTIGNFMMFLVGAVMLIFGMGFFQLGAEIAMTPLGEGIGAELSRSKHIWMILFIGFLMGVVITISEPDLQVLAEQVPSVPNAALIWTVAIGVGIFLHMLLSAAIAGNREVLLSGIGVNVPTSEAGITCLTDDYLTRLEGTKQQTVQYLNEVLDFDNPAMGQEVSYSTVVKVSGLIPTEGLDYLILDSKALEYYSQGDIFMDLRQLLPQEELAQLNILEIGGVPMLIDLTGTWFAQTHITGQEPYYLGFAYNTPRAEACKELWQYLQSGE